VKDYLTLFLAYPTWRNPKYKD